MKIIASRDALKVALALAVKAIPASAAQSELSCAHFRAQGDSVEVSATDGTYSARVSFDALIEEPGEALVSALRLSALMRAMPDQAVTLEADCASAAVVCGASSSRVPALNPIGFPAFPRVEAQATVTLPFAMFKSAAARAAKFCAKPGKDDKATTLTGVLVEWGDSELRMVSTDSYRVSIERMPIAGDGEGSAIIPQRLLADISALDDPRSAEVAISENQVLVRVGGCELVSRRVAGKFPSWRKFDEVANHQAMACFKREALLGAARRALALGRLGDHPSLAIADGCDLAELSRDMGAEGGSSEDVPCAGAAGSVSVKLHGDYLQEALAAVPSDEVVVEWAGGRQPVMFRAPDRAYRIAVMPMVG
ncbi:MAG: DNA polymerase III subunit beta [Gordonibacter sp.]|uniref:DNA polymerase III subunit beta n=1 Tax=Gordonibacter sp. TaxID=1968902 RepID=UPI002FC86627